MNRQHDISRDATPRDDEALLRRLDRALAPDRRSEQPRADLVDRIVDATQHRLPRSESTGVLARVGDWRGRPGWLGGLAAAAAVVVVGLAWYTVNTGDPSGAAPDHGLAVAPGGGAERAPDAASIDRIEAELASIGAYLTGDGDFAGSTGAGAGAAERAGVGEPLDPVIVAESDGWSDDADLIDEELALLRMQLSDAAAVSPQRNDIEDWRDWTLETEVDAFGDSF